MIVMLDSIILHSIINNKHDNFEIDLVIDNMMYRTLIDTGSSYSLIDKNIINKFNSSNINNNIAGHLYCGDNKMFDIISEIYVDNILYNDIKFNMYFKVVSELSLTKYNIVLGNDFLSTYGVIINFRTRELIL